MFFTVIAPDRFSYSKGSMTCSWRQHMDNNNEDKNYKCQVYWNQRSSTEFWQDKGLSLVTNSVSVGGRQWKQVTDCKGRDEGQTLYQWNPGVNVRIDGQSYNFKSVFTYYCDCLHLKKHWTSISEIWSGAQGSSTRIVQLHTKTYPNNIFVSQISLMFWDISCMGLSSYVTICSLSRSACLTP